MKDFLSILWRFCVILVIIVVCLFLLSSCKGARQIEAQVIHDTILIERPVDDEWKALIGALIQIESNGNDSAVNYKTKAVGCLQLTPVCVQQVNQILKAEVFDLNDRYDRAKSIAMFDVYQGYYNPDRDIHWALKLWNPRSSIQYHLDVMNKMSEL